MGMICRTLKNTAKQSCSTLYEKSQKPFFVKTLYGNLKSKNGFTLLEVIVSLAILSISIVAILQLFSGGLRSIKVSDDYLRASILAQNKMNELESKFSIFENSGGFFRQDERYEWSLFVENYDLPVLDPKFENIENKGKEVENPIFVDKVTLKVFWKTKHGQREIELVTLKSSTVVKPAPKEILESNYPTSLIVGRGLQFGNQDIPEGQSRKQYERLTISGRTSLYEKAHICGTPRNIPRSNISGN